MRGKSLKDILNPRFLRSVHLWLIAHLVIIASQFALAQGVHINLRANINPNPPHYNTYAEVWGDGNYAYVASQRQASGVQIFNISNPNAPVLVAKYAPANISLNMQGLSVSNGIGYFGDDAGGGLQIVDLSNPSQPTLIKQITSANGGYDNVHDLFYDGNGHVYLPNYRVNADVQVWDVSNPANPFKVTTITGHDPSSTHDVTVIGNRMYMAGWSGTIDIWDITNIQSPTLLGYFQSDPHSQDIWPTVDGNYLVVPHELTTGGLIRIYDISNPANVALVSTINGATLGISAVTPVETRVMNNLLYVSWYQAGLIVFDITDPRNPIMVGSYDTYPGPVINSTYLGAWGVYPFLGQDRVLVSDQNTGLYILDCTGLSSQPALYNYTLNPMKVTGGLAQPEQIFLVGQAQAGGYPVTLTANGPIGTGTITVPAGTSSANFTEPTNAVAANTPVTATASDGTYTISATTTLTPPVPKIVVAPLSVVGGNSVTGTASLNVAPVVATNISITVLSGAGAVQSIPSTVTVAAGTTSTSFVISTLNVSSSTAVQVSAAANGGTSTAKFTVTPDVPASVSFSPATVVGGSTSTGTLQLAAPVNSDTVVSLTVVSGAVAVSSVPTTVTVSAGTRSSTFSVVTNPVSSQTVVKISASLNGVSKTGSLTVK